MNSAKSTEASHPQTTKKRRKTWSVATSKTPTRESLKLSPSNGVSLARILRQFTRNTANETNSAPVSVAAAHAPIPCTRACQASSTSVTISSANNIELITRLCEKLPEGHATPSSETSEDHKSGVSSVGASCKQNTLYTSTSPLELAPDPKGVLCSTNPTLHRLAYYATVGPQNANSTDPNDLKVPEDGLQGKQLFRVSEGGAKTTCSNASEGVLDTTCGAHSKTPLERRAALFKGRASTTCFTRSKSATNTCLNTQGVSSDKELRLREERISRLKEFVHRKEKEVERITHQLHSLEERKVSLALETATLHNVAEKRATVPSHGSGSVSRVSKLRSTMSVKKMRLQRASDDIVHGKPAVYSVNSFLPNCREKGFLEFIGLEVVVESMRQRNVDMSQTK